MKKIGILGATGFTGHELLKILKNHPEVEIAALNSRNMAGQPVNSLYKDYDGTETYSGYSLQEINALEPDLIFSALPHKVSMEGVAQLDDNIKVIDLSADYRFQDVNIYEQVYQRSHIDPGTKATYGLPELFENEIKNARLVANPGCYATVATLTTYPIQEHAAHIVLDCKSGWSGAGRESPYAKDPSIIKDNLVAYNLTKHRHKYEIEQFIKAKLSFTPHVLDTFQGMMCTAHLLLADNFSAQEAFEMYAEFYKDSTFVKVSQEIPQLRDTQKTNYCQIGGFEVDDAGRMVIVATIDNLIKGASGQAVQNMNLMLGFDPATALT